MPKSYVLFFLLSFSQYHSTTYTWHEPRWRFYVHIRQSFLSLSSFFLFMSIYLIMKCGWIGSDIVASIVLKTYLCVWNVFATENIV